MLRKGRFYILEEDYCFLPHTTLGLDSVVPVLDIVDMSLEAVTGRELLAYVHRWGIQEFPQLWLDRYSWESIGALPDLETLRKAEVATETERRRVSYSYYSFSDMDDLGRKLRSFQNSVLGIKTPALVFDTIGNGFYVQVHKHKVHSFKLINSRMYYNKKLIYEIVPDSYLEKCTLHILLRSASIVFKSYLRLIVALTSDKAGTIHSCYGIMYIYISLKTNSICSVSCSLTTSDHELRVYPKSISHTYHNGLSALCFMEVIRVEDLNEKNALKLLATKSKIAYGEEKTDMLLPSIK